MSKELTQEERGAIAAFEAMKNSSKLTRRMMKLIKLCGTSLVLDTVNGRYRAYQFFGKLYAG